MILTSPQPYVAGNVLERFSEIEAMSVNLLTRWETEGYEDWPASAGVRAIICEELAPLLPAEDRDRLAVAYNGLVDHVESVTKYKDSSNSHRFRLERLLPGQGMLNYPHIDGGMFTKLITIAAKKPTIWVYGHIEISEVAVDSFMANTLPHWIIDENITAGRCQLVSFQPGDVVVAPKRTYHYSDPNDTMNPLSRLFFRYAY